jgi:AbrB family looped-hinge helix DNA binding protein
MPPFSTIRSKGRIAVPLEIRSRLGLNAADRVEFIVRRRLHDFAPGSSAEESV